MRIATTLSFLCCVTFNCGTAMAENIQFQTGMNFDWWGDSRNNNARQVSVPVSVTGRTNDFSYRLLTAYTDTRLEKSGPGDASLGHQLDTKLSLSYEIVDKLPVDILLGLDFNLPTGKTNLRKGDLTLIMDPDLVSINNFGEGFDINPTLTATKEWKNWVGGFSFGYLWRGSYDFSSELNITDYQPGDIYNVNAELRYYFSPTVSTRVFGGHAWYGPDTVRDSKLFQEGDFSQFGLGLYYSQEKKWDAGVTFRGISRDKSKFQGPSGHLVTESRNRRGDEWIVDLAGRYVLDEKTALRSFVQGRYFTENDYASTSSFYVGKREKVLFGIGVTRAFGPHFEAGLDIKGFFKHDDERNYPQFLSSRDYHGMSVTLLFAGNF